MFCHFCSMTSIDGAPTPWVWVTRHQWLTGEKTHSRETRLQHQRFQNKWKCAIVEGGHGELGSYLSKVVSLGQVLGSSVETSSCLLDLTQQLFKDSTDATQTPIVVWTGQKEATEVCSAHADLRCTLVVLCTASSSENHTQLLLLLTKLTTFNWGSAWSA